MRILALALGAAAVVGCQLQLVPAGPPPKVDSWPRLLESGKVMGTAELVGLLQQARKENRPLKGYGLTVFEGTKIERFEFEIVDIVANYIYPKHELIMFRGAHKKWLDGGNVIAGMSGSPCYVNEKMIGALSYRLGSFQRDALGGITPIEYMIREMDRPVEEARAMPTVFDERGPVPVKTPLLVGGFSPRVLKAFEKTFESDFLMMAPTAGGSLAQDPGDRFEPGSAIGASLMTGDFDMTGIGTVTFVEDDKVLAFGHPFFGAGQLEVPITTAVIHTTFQGFATAYKLGSPGKVVGALVHDRANAIFGRVGKAARMIPVTLTLKNPKVHTEQIVRVQLADHPTYVPMLLSMTQFAAIDAFEPSDNPRIVKSDVAVTLKGGRTIAFADVVQYDPLAGSAGRTSAVGKVYAIVRNQYAKPEIESIAMAVETVNERRAATLKNVWTLQDEVEDGGTVKLHCVLRRFRGGEVTRDIELSLPKGVPSGTELSIRVGGGLSIAPERAPASTLEEFLDALEKDYRATSIVAVAELPAYKLLYRGNALDRLPNSALAQLVPTLEETAALGNADARATVDTDWIVTGSAVVKVKVK